MILLLSDQTFMYITNVDFPDPFWTKWKVYGVSEMRALPRIKLILSWPILDTYTNGVPADFILKFLIFVTFPLISFRCFLLHTEMAVRKEEPNLLTIIVAFLHTPLALGDAVFYIVRPHIWFRFCEVFITCNDSITSCWYSDDSLFNIKNRHPLTTISSPFLSFLKILFQRFVQSSILILYSFETSSMILVSCALYGSNNSPCCWWIEHIISIFTCQYIV